MIKLTKEDIVSNEIIEWYDGPLGYDGPLEGILKLVNKDNIFWTCEDIDQFTYVGYKISDIQKDNLDNVLLNHETTAWGTDGGKAYDQVVDQIMSSSEPQYEFDLDICLSVSSIET